MAKPHDMCQLQQLVMTSNRDARPQVARGSGLIKNTFNFYGVCEQKISGSAFTSLAAARYSAGTVARYSAGTVARYSAGTVVRTDPHKHSANADTDPSPTIKNPVTHEKRFIQWIKFGVFT
jgi:hypothetical protein